MIKKMKRKLILYIGMLMKILIAAPFIIPFYVAFVYSFKSKRDIAFTGLQFPNPMQWSNFPAAIEYAKFWSALSNSIVTTLPVVIMLTVFCSAGAYIIARKNNTFYNSVYYVMVGAMIIPFQVIMTPLYLNLSQFGLINTRLGFILTRTGFQVAFSLLLLTGFVKNVPIELEESAKLDGAGRYRTFVSIVVPLMQPIIITAILLNTIYTWNDFQVAAIILQKESMRTLPLMQYYFFSENRADLNLAFAAFILSMIPILTMYFILQKRIISGITSGAVKG